ncbi:MAG: serine hydrolase domain-containing protein [Microbacterium sp.]
MTKKRDERPSLDSVIEELVAETGPSYTALAVSVSSPHTETERFAGTLAIDDRTAVDARALFDIASLSKTMVAVLAARLVAAQRLDLDEPVRRYLPVGSGSGADRITMRHLLTHTAGFPSDVFLWRHPLIPAPERLSHVLSTALQTPPGQEFRYSCTGFIAAGAVLERIAGAPLDGLLREQVWSALGMDDTGYGPVAPENAVVTERQDYIGRGLVRGEVHDELSWYLGSRTGNAGVFSTLGDMRAFAASFVDDSAFGAEVHRLTTTDQRPAGACTPYRHALGIRIGDATFMGDADVIGHTGFTGTMWFADPAGGSAGVMLTNRVHPSRELVDIGPLRRRFVEAAASSRSRPPRPSGGAP